MPLHQLPPKLLRMICVYLEPADVAEIRLLDRNIAAVGLEYIVAQIHLIPTGDSFDRLFAVAEHPAANQYVTSIYYEADLLKLHVQQRDDREEWEERIVGPEFAAPLKEVRGSTFTSLCDQLPRRYTRAPLVPSSQHQHHYTTQEIRQAYEKYQKHVAEQRRIHKSVAYEDALVRAMKRLPRLSSFIISCRRGNTNHYRAAFEPVLSENVTPHSMHTLIGGYQLALLLSAADRAGLQITKLVCGSFGHDFCNQSIERQDAMTRSIRHLRSLHLFLSTPYPSDSNAVFNTLGTNTEPSVSARFVASAPKLEALSIRFNKAPTIPPPDLDQFVCDFHWSCLVSATFANMNTGPETLIGFCGRHGGTLKDFKLKDITLHTGQWALTFFEMRQRLELKRMVVVGIIRSHQGDYWDLTSAKCSTRRMIQRYILHKDKMPRDTTFSTWQSAKSTVS